MPQGSPRRGAVVDEDLVAGVDRHVQVDAVGVAGGAGRRPTILPTYQPLPGLTTQMLNWPLATAVLGVQLTGRAAPWALLVVPVGAVTVMALKPARSR